MKKTHLFVILAIATLVLIAVFIFLFLRHKKTLKPQAQGTIASMNLTSSEQSVGVNNNFDVAVSVNTGGAETIKASAVISYDQNYLEVVDLNSSQDSIQISPGTFYPNVLQNSVEGGKITFTAASTSPVTGSGTLATVKFKATKVTDSTNLTFVYDGTANAGMSFVLSSADTNPNILASPVGAGFQISQAVIAPTLDLKIDSQDGTINKNLNESAVLSWTSTNTTGCSASGGWSGTKAISGLENTGPLQTSATYKLTCNGNGGSTSDSVGVSINGMAPPSLSSQNQNSSANKNTKNTAPALLTPSSSDKIASLPTNLAPQTAPPAPKPSKELFAAASMKPWVLWLCYALIPAFIAAGTIFYYLRRRPSRRPPTV